MLGASPDKAAPVASAHQHSIVDDSVRSLELSWLRQQELIKHPIPYVGDRLLFSEEGARQRIVEAPEPLGALPKTQPHHQHEANALQLTLAQPILTKDQELYLFRKMNYLKFEADELRETLSAEQPEPKTVARIEQFLKQALEIRERLINANLKLVISIGGKYLREDQRRSPHEFLDDSLSEGALDLVRAVDLFDVERGFAFSTYATCSMINGFKNARSSLRQHVAFGAPSVFCIDEYDFPERASEYSSPVVSAERSEFNQRLASLFNQHLDQIGNERCQRVIRGLYGLNGEAPKNKGEVAEELGISKDQVVQIENSTLKRLRTRLSRSGLSPD